MICKNHPNTEAITHCATCGEAFCDACLNVVDGARYCAPCAIQACQAPDPAPARREPPSIPPMRHAAVPPLPSPTGPTSTSGLAIASLVCGAMSICCAVSALPGIICGVMALTRIEASKGRLDGRGLAIAGIALSCSLFIIGIGMNAAILLPALARAREAARRASCQNNLKAVALVFHTFEQESPAHTYPELSPESGQLIFNAKQVFPKYLSDTNLLICPSNPTHGVERPTPNTEAAVNDDSYTYLGYVITNDDEMEAFSQVYEQRIAQGLPFDQDLPAPPGRGSLGGDVFLRFGESFEKALREKSGDFTPYNLPVMWETMGNDGGYDDYPHIPGGINVLYLDGHTEFISKWKPVWPISEKTIAALVEMDAVKKGKKTL